MKNEQLPEKSPSDTQTSHDGETAVSDSAYNLSKDYFHLFRLLCDNKKIACFVNYQFRSLEGKYPPHRDLCIAKRNSQYDISFGSRGIEYGSVSSFERNKANEFDLFKIECDRMNVEYIVP